MQNVLVIGSGAREHALVRSFSNCDEVNIFSAPGNPGIAQHAKCFAINFENLEGVISLCRNEKIDYVVVGPEAPLATGIVNYLEKEGITTFGPRKSATILETSKIFTRILAKEASILSPSYWIASSLIEASNLIRSLNRPLAIKANGLQAGKGVFMTKNAQDAQQALLTMKQQHMISKGESLLLEECLHGKEVSFFALCHGKKAIPLMAAEDYKRLSSVSTSPNTGGMGAIAPSLRLPENRWGEVMEQMVFPLLTLMEKRGTPFHGVLFLGLMLQEADPYLLEVNVRFGDPECQTFLPLLKTNLYELLTSVQEGRFDVPLVWEKKSAVTVVLASQGYPQNPGKGHLINGLDEASKHAIIHHGATQEKNGDLLSCGGRVLSLTGLGDTLEQAREKAYCAAKHCSFSGKIWRDDIGQ